MFLACLLYADDICLLAPSRGAMQELLNICEEYCLEFCLSFNVKKSKILLFGNTKGKSVSPLSLNGQPIEFVSQWKYLGITIVTGNTVCYSSQSELSNFYRSYNSILSLMKKPNDLVLMNLLYTNCVPNLTYGAEVKEFSSKELQDLNTALNNAIRRIFSYNRWESIRLLREQLGFPNMTETFQKRKKKFLAGCKEIDNEVIRFIDFIFFNCDL